MIHRFNFIEKLLLNKDLIPHPFADIGSMPALGKALGVAVKMKITDQLGPKAKSVAQIARGASVSEKGAELVLDCLAALGYVVRTGDGYRFTRRGSIMLDRGSPRNMLHFIAFADQTYDSFVDLEDSIRYGRTSRNNLKDFSQEDWDLFSRAMIDVARTNLTEVTAKIRLPEGAKRIIDLGGSHGLYSIALCQKHPGLAATVLDLEPVRKFAEESIAAANVQGRVAYSACDFMQDALPAGQDAALLFNIIHGFSPEQNTALFSKVSGSLNKGGRLIILDQIKGTGGSSQLSQATTSFMAINLFHQANGNAYSHEEVSAWSKAAGFNAARLDKLNAPGFGLITCMK